MAKAAECHLLPSLALGNALNLTDVMNLILCSFDCGLQFLNPRTCRVVVVLFPHVYFGITAVLKYRAPGEGNCHLKFFLVKHQEGIYNYCFSGKFCVKQKVLEHRMFSAGISPEGLASWMACNGCCSQGEQTHHCQQTQPDGVTFTAVRFQMMQSVQK